MYIKTERLELKPITDNDKENVIALLTNDVVKQTYMISDFESEEQVEKLFQRLRDLSLSDTFYQAGIFLESELIGIANEVERTTASIELGYAILPQFHNKGYGTEMLKVLIEQMFSDGFSQVITGAFEENVPSQQACVKI